MKKINLRLLLICFTIIILFKYSNLVSDNLVILLNNFIKNVIPSMFPIIFITNYIKYKLLPLSNDKYLRFICLIFSFAPSNAIIANSYKEILYSTIINPLFSFNILINFFTIKKSLIIIVINMLINYLLLYLNTANIKNNSLNANDKCINDIIKETIYSLINILGVIIFYNILISILSILVNTNLLVFFEITNGFNIISNMKSSSIKNILLIFMNSFCGLSIFTQIKSINNDANYKLIINKLFLSIIITVITYLIIMIL